MTGPPMQAHEPSNKLFDAAALKREFPGLAAPGLHYLDSAATAQMPEVVLDALRRFEVEARANVHEGLHARARAATDAYNQARVRVARFLGAGSEDEVVFTYGATSAINLLAYSFGSLLAPGDEILLSILEHHSNLVPWQQLARRQGVVLRFLPMTPEGRLDLDRLDSELTERCRLVALTHCSNVTGALTDVARVVSSGSFGRGQGSCSTAPSGRRTARSTCRPSASISMPFRATRPTDRPASACCGGAASCWRPCRRS